MAYRLQYRNINKAQSEWCDWSTHSFASWTSAIEFKMSAEIAAVRDSLPHVFRVVAINDPAPFKLMAREFPDYDQSTLPVIPRFWQDTSWHNDVCPSFTATPLALDGTGVHIFIDYPTAAERQFPECARFSAYLANAAGERTIEVDGDNWGDILRTVSAMLLEWEAILAINAAGHVQTFKALCAEFREWALANDRPEGDAFDNLMDERNTPQQLAWLSDFNSRWDEMEDAVNDLQLSLAKEDAQPDTLTQQTIDELHAAIARIEEGR